jgi:capreomycidine synthase
MKRAFRPPRAYLEEWMREHYFAAEIDIGSSGVESYSLKQIRDLAGPSSEALDAVVFRDSQTLGGDAVRAAIARRMAEDDVSRVMVTHGSSEANYRVMRTLLEADDEIIVPQPRYPQLATVAEMIGCRILQWELRWEDGFAPSIAELRRLITPRTHMVVANFPHNPTGTTLSRHEQRQLIDICAEAGAYLVWDAAFSDLVYDTEPLPDPALSYARAISLGTLSKAFGLPGLRIGWCIGAPDVLAGMVRLRDHMTLHLSPLVELIAEHAIEQADRLLAPRLAQASHNRQCLADWVAANAAQVSWTPPRGGVCAAVAFAGIDKTDALCVRLSRVYKTLVVPGICFGDGRWIRIGFGGATVTLVEGLRRINLALASSGTGIQRRCRP